MGFHPYLQLLILFGIIHEVIAKGVNPFKLILNDVFFFGTLHIFPNEYHLIRIPKMNQLSQT